MLYLKMGFFCPLFRRSKDTINPTKHPRQATRPTRGDHRSLIHPYFNPHPSGTQPSRGDHRSLIHPISIHTRQERNHLGSTTSRPNTLFQSTRPRGARQVFLYPSIANALNLAFREPLLS